MSILGLIASLVMFVIAMIIVARPLLRPSRTRLEIETNIERQRDRLLIYYETCPDQHPRSRRRL